MKYKFRCSYLELIHLSLPGHRDGDTQEDSINYRHFRDYLSIAIYTYLKQSFKIYSGWWTVLISDCTFKKPSVWTDWTCLLHYTQIHIALTQLVINQALKETSLFQAPYAWTTAELDTDLKTCMLVQQGIADATLDPTPHLSTLLLGCRGAYCTPSSEQPQAWSCACPCQHSWCFCSCSWVLGGEYKEKIARNNLSDYVRWRRHSLK